MKILENLFLEVPGLEGHHETHNLTILINCQMIALCDTVLYNEAFRFMHKLYYASENEISQVKGFGVSFFPFFFLVIDIVL